MSFMGLDLGGSGAKAAAFSVDGSLLAAAKVPYVIESPRPGCLELNPGAQWNALAEAIRAVTSSDPIRHNPITAVGISVAGDAVVPVAADRSPLYNSMPSFDPRGSEYVPLLQERVGEEEIFRITGQPLDGMYSLMRILWFRDEIPEIFHKTWKFCLWQELVLIRLGLEPSIDYSNAARTMAFDIHSKQWSATILDSLDLADSLFAPVVPQGEILGCVSHTVADELGLARNCIVVAGGLDQSTAGLGLGVVDARSTAIGTGSVEAISVPVQATESLRRVGGEYFFVTPYLPGGFLGTGLNFTAGSAIEWLRGLTGGVPLEELEPVAGGLLDNAGAPSVFVLPQFAGSFSPRRNKAARAAMLGLSLDVTGPDIFRALIVGLVFELRLTIESMERAGLRVSEIRNGGGGSRSDYWMRLKATVLNKPIWLPEERDSSCLGAALVAAVGSGMFRNCSSAAAAMVRMARQYEPESSVVGEYDARYEEYRTARAILESNECTSAWQSAAGWRQ
jgi:xylulokinase